MSPSEANRSRLPSAAAGVLCAVTALYLGGSTMDARQVAKANDLGRGGDYAGAADGARRAIESRPADGRALLTLATALERQGRRDEASSTLAIAARRYPNNYVIHLRQALVLSELGRDREAGQAMSRALVLNPLMEVPAPFSVLGDER